MTYQPTLPGMEFAGTHLNQEQFKGFVPMHKDNIGTNMFNHPEHGSSRVGDFHFMVEHEGTPQTARMRSWSDRRPPKVFMDSDISAAGSSWKNAPSHDVKDVNVLGVSQDRKTNKFGQWGR